jgi:DNA repair protein RecN (Recombination protein N)
MLKSLHIEDFILVECVDLDFGPGFTALTGETGAGKSIIVTAVELLLGGRGDSLLVRRGAARARLEALFEVGPAADAALAAAEVEAPDGELVLRRDLGAEGRSRCYANGRPVTVAAVAEIARALVELHGQFSELPALRGGGQTDILDDFGRLAAARADFAEAYERWQALRAERRRLETSRAERGVLLDGLTFMVTELEGARLMPGEEEDLKTKRARLQYAARIAADVEGGLAALSEGENAVAVQLAALRKCVADLAQVIPAAAAPLARVDEAAAALDDVARELLAYRGADADEPASLDEVEARLATVERLKRKYDRDVPALLEHLAELKAKLAELGRVDDRLTETAREVAAAGAAAGARAAELTAARRDAAAALGERVAAEMPTLGLAGARFDVAFAPPAAPTDAGEGAPPLGPAGAEEAVFLFAANPGEELRPLAKAASGGELSRVMLAVRAASAGRAGVGTIIFDEVDSGIGGRVGHAVGRRLREVAAERQVICVTHLAQIASRATAQYVVDKTLENDRAEVAVRRVDGDARREELARMLGGGKPPTPTTLKHAEEMLAAAAAEMTPAGRRGKAE